jgi:PAS domain S-box-containing protein
VNDIRPISPVTFQTESKLVHESPDKLWFLWVLQDVALWKVNEFQTIDSARKSMERIWEIFLSLREKYSKLYVIIDITEVPILSPEVRQYLLDEWIHLIDRDDLTLCLLDPDSFRRVIRNAMSSLAGKLDRFRFYKDLDSAFSFINAHRELESTRALPQKTRKIFQDLVKQHKHLAAITELNPSTEKNIDDRELQLQNLFEDFPVAVFYCDLFGRFRWGNKVAEELSGYRREELIGKPYYRTGLTNIKDLKKVSEIFSESIHRKATGPIEFTLNRRDDTIRFIEITTYLMPLTYKKILLCFANDVTERGLQNVLREAGAETQKIATICAHCGKLRDRHGKWHTLESFHLLYMNTLFSHSICPTCLEKYKADY